MIATGTMSNHRILGSNSGFESTQVVEKTDSPETKPDARRRRGGARQKSALSSSLRSNVNDNTQSTDVAEEKESPSTKPDVRRRRGDAREKSALSSSLRTNRRDGLKATRGRLSVSFTDTKGLSGSDINEILAGFEDEAELKREESLKDIFGGSDSAKEDKKSLKFNSSTDFNSSGSRPTLETIQSQKSMAFSFDPAFDLNDD